MRQPGAGALCEAREHVPQRAERAISRARSRDERQSIELSRMTEPLFLLDDLADPLPIIGAHIVLAGDEGRHAAVVRRIRPGEMIMIGNGRGLGVRGAVIEVRGSGLLVEVVDHLSSSGEPRCLVAAQALAKGDRSELAVEMMTEIGVSEIVPWQASRSIVRWSPERAARSLAKWRSAAREAAKQSRHSMFRRCRNPLTLGSWFSAQQALILLWCCMRKPRSQSLKLIFQQQGQC